jgi:hypothetical protein
LEISDRRKVTDRMDTCSITDERADGIVMDSPRTERPARGTFQRYVAFRSLFTSKKKNGVCLVGC